MNIRLAAKDFAERLPDFLARALPLVPFAIRLGPEYNRSRLLITQLRKQRPIDNQKWLLDRLQKILEHAFATNAFYRDLFGRSGFHPSRLKTLEHLKDIPVVSKAELRKYHLDERSAPGVGRIKVNTGGTSGEPLEFYVDAGAFAREWAHMHTIWESAGYSPREIKLTLRGRNLGEVLLRYNGVHNEYVLNVYAQKAEACAALEPVIKSGRLRWIHGYPSLVAEFVDWLGANRPMLLNTLRKNLKGVLLGSEFPAPHYRAIIADVLAVPIVSWYGHSEMSALANEHAPNEYVPFQSYGFCEAVETGRGTRLVTTSLWNRASHFIRYDTGDGIEAHMRNGLLERFRITEGRIGEFILDRTGIPIGLTALIFGRHHAAFEKTRHVQVRQRRPGEIDLLLVPRDPRCAMEELIRGFDFTHVQLDVSFILIDEPIRTTAGKTPLLVN
jgi:phenylacetate-CoA ligase